METERRADKMTKPEKVKDAAIQRIGDPYVYGGTGKQCTPSYRSARAIQYPNYASQIENNCPRLSGSATSCANCKWADPETKEGRPCYDCAQFVLACMAAAGIPLVSGANSQWQKTRFTENGEISAMPTDKVAMIFRRDSGKMAHVGLYMGDGTVIHARGHKYGVVHDNLDEVRFTHYGIPAGLYDDLMPTLRKGNSGEYVKILQTALNAAGQQLHVDGIFGAATEDAVQDFQGKNGLKTDGVCGPQTWAALDPYIPEKDPDEDPGEPTAPEVDDDDLPVGIIALTYEQAAEMRNLLKRALMILETAMR